MLRVQCWAEDWYWTGRLRGKPAEDSREFQLLRAKLTTNEKDIQDNAETYCVMVRELFFARHNHREKV